MFLNQFEIEIRSLTLQLLVQEKKTQNQEIRQKVIQEC